MPTYDYECETCGKTFEVFQSMASDAYTKCPPDVCKKRGQVKRLIGVGGGLLFKGAGFYLTDYRSDSYKAGAKADKAPSSKTDTSSAKKKKVASPKKGSS